MLLFPHLLEKSSKSKRIVAPLFPEEFTFKFCGLEETVDGINGPIVEYNAVGSFKTFLSDVIIDYQHRDRLDTTLQALVTLSTFFISFSTHSS